MPQRFGARRLQELDGAPSWREEIPGVLLTPIDKNIPTAADMQVRRGSLRACPRARSLGIMPHASWQWHPECAGSGGTLWREHATCEDVSRRNPTSVACGPAVRRFGTGPCSWVAASPSRAQRRTVHGVCVTARSSGGWPVPISVARCASYKSIDKLCY